MSSRFATASAVLLALGACGGADEAGMPTGDHVHSLGVTADGGLLLGLHGGLYRSADGVVWDLAGLSGEDAMVVTTGAEGPVFVAGHEILYRSDDGGGTFSPLQPVDLPGLDIHGFAQTQTDGEVVYAFIVGHGLFVSRDAGETWEPRASVDSIPGDVFGIAAVGPGDETLVSVGPESGVLRSENGGRSFERVFEVSSGAVAVDREAPDTVWALSGVGLARSNDSGRTWEVISSFDGVEGQPVTLALGRGELWIVTEQPRNLYRSDDAGMSWDRIAGT